MHARAQGLVTRRLVGSAGLLASAVFGVLQGCKSVETIQPPKVAAAHPMLQDIPKPEGFRLVDDRSVARSTGRYRVAKVEFLGGTKRDEVSRFYKDMMPTAGFALTEERFDRGECQMRFASETEECTVRIRPEQWKTALVIDIGPLPQATPEREPTTNGRRVRAPEGS